MVAKIIGIERHRITTDGNGITTLVAFHGCPLRCKYCLNPQCLNEKLICRSTTPQELLEEVRVDNLYFLATGGGVTFGGTLSKILCKWKQDSVISFFLYLDSVFKDKHKLVHNQSPVCNRHRPFLLNLPK